MRRGELASIRWEGSWFGALLVAAGLCLALAGTLGTIYLLVHIAIIIVLMGLALACLGWRGTRIIWFPLVYLIFMIPLPDFFQVRLSAEMQLWASALGVAVIRFFDISVFLEGNVIDLGVYKLQVVEACSGLRYLFPLMSFGFLVAYMYKGRFWERALVFLSTIPITIFMNSFRIGVIGVLVESYGIEMAEGFLHDFEGWLIFMACSLILLLEIRILAFFDPQRRPFMQMFGLPKPAHA